MRYKQSYCRFCSVNANDIRLLKIEKYSMQCSNCGKKLFLIPIDESSPYYYLEDISEIRLGRL